MKTFLLVLSLSFRALSQDPLELEEQRRLNQERLEKENYQTGRDLVEYASYFGVVFTRLLARLGNGVWVDFGSGAGNALIEYHERAAAQRVFPTGVTLGVTLSRREEQLRFPKEVEKKWVDSGKLRFLEEPVEKIPREEIGEFIIGTDLFGPLSYTEDLTTVLQGYIDLVVQDRGALFLVTGENRDPLPQDTWIQTGPDTKVLLADWIQTLPGLQTDIFRDSRSAFAVVRIRRKADKCIIPLLKLTELRASNPPARLFELVP